LPQACSSGFHVYHQYCIRTPKRDALKAYLAERGIDTLIHYPVPPHKQNAYHDFNSMPLRISEEICNTILSLPLYPGIPDEHIAFVADAAMEFFN